MTIYNKLEYIIGSDLGLTALEQTSPIIYYKDSKPYGFISFVNYRDGILILSATKDDSPFLFEMILIIRKIAKICKVYILHNVNRKDISDAILKAFGKRFIARQLKTDKCILTIGRYRNGNRPNNSVNS